jgi:uncharacterized protein YlaN (UPF0358 family)
LKNETVEEVKKILKWALDNAEFSQCAVQSAKNEDGMYTLTPNPPDFDFYSTIESIDEEDVKTFEIKFKFENRKDVEKRLVFRIDVYNCGEIHMIYLGLLPEDFDELDKLDILQRV